MNVTNPSAGHVVLYTPRQIYVASFLGSPAAAAWFMALNHRAVSQTKEQRQMLILGGVATVAVFVVAFFLPERTPNIMWPLAYSIGIYYFAHARFGDTVTKHLAEGGQRGSWWRVLGVSLLFLLGIFAVLFVVIGLLPALLPGSDLA